MKAKGDGAEVVKLKLELATAQSARATAEAALTDAQQMSTRTRTRDLLRITARARCAAGRPVHSPELLPAYTVMLRFGDGGEHKRLVDGRVLHHQDRLGVVDARQVHQYR